MDAVAFSATRTTEYLPLTLGATVLQSDHEVSVRNATFLPFPAACTYAGSH